MAPVWLVVVLLLVPAVAAAQAPIVVPSPVISPFSPIPTIINPQTPPPTTIPSAPDILFPIPPPPSLRPTKTFEFRPTLSVGEEYTDNFNLAPTNKITNYRSTLSPGLGFVLDSGFLTGQATYVPSVFYDTSVDDIGVHHTFAGQLVWEATPRLKFTLTDGLSQNDDPNQSNRLNLSRGRQEFTSNILSVTSDLSLGLVDTREYYRWSIFTSQGDTTTTNTAGASASVPILKINRVRLGYEYLDSVTHAKQGSTATNTFFGTSSDSTTIGHEVTAAVSRDMRKDLTAGVSGSYATREQTMTGGNSHFTRWNVSVFSNYVVPDTIVSRSNIGVSELTTDTPGASGSGRPLVTSSSELLYYLGPAILGLKIERGFSETFGLGQNFGVVETSGYSGSVVYRFTPLLSVTGIGSYRENNFRGEGGGVAGRDDKIVSGSAQLTYRIVRWLFATLEYTYTDAKSSDPTAAYVENRARIALNALFY